MTTVTLTVQYLYTLSHCPLPAPLFVVVIRVSQVNWCSAVRRPSGGRNVHRLRTIHEAYHTASTRFSGCFYTGMLECG